MIVNSTTSPETAGAGSFSITRILASWLAFLSNQSCQKCQPAGQLVGLYVVSICIICLFYLTCLVYACEINIWFHISTLCPWAIQQKIWMLPLTQHSQHPGMVREHIVLLCALCVAAHYLLHKMITFVHAINNPTGWNMADVMCLVKGSTQSATIIFKLYLPVMPF